jgi:GNAT superfamily N-acetyltransferase
MTEPHWTIRAARPDEAPAILELACAVHGRNRPELNESYLQWRYWNGTPFQAEILMAEQEGRAIGIQPVAIFDFQQGRERFKGAMYTGVMTHPEHRRRGVFRRLVDASNEFAARRGAAFSMTMPNDSALAGFKRFGDWHYPGPIPTWFKLLDGRAALQAKAGAVIGRTLGWLPHLVLSRRRRVAVDLDRYTCEQRTKAGDDLDEIADRSADETAGILLCRTSAYWNWRYCVRPPASYRPTGAASPEYHTLIVKDRTSPVGAVVTSVARQHGLDVGLIIDLIACGGAPVLRRLLYEAELDLRRRGLALIAAQATDPLLQMTLKEQGYFYPKHSWLARPFHFVYRPTGTGGPLGGGLQASDWYLTLGDSDNT